MKTKSQAVIAKKIICIGASAGGLDPMQRLIATIPDEVHDAAYVVAQHLSPHYKSMLGELLSKQTQREVKDIKDRMLIEANVIYVVPPNHHVVIRDKHFSFSPNETMYPKPSVSLLFESAGKEFGDEAVGIVLSGTGKDGSTGAQELRKYGGRIVAQDPDTCKYMGMPQNTIKTGTVDYILTAEKIGKNLLSIMAGDSVKGNKHIKDTKLKTPEELAVIEVLGLLEQRLRVDFSNYKKSTINRRLQKRLEHGKFKKMEDYVDHLNQTPTELDELFNDMLIGVTRFFRDKAVFKNMETTIEQILKTRTTTGEQIRMWIPGCASGEEAYTYAILFHEVARKKNFPSFQLQIFATDIDADNLAIARKGSYTRDQVKEVDADVLDRYFVRDGDRYEVATQLKKHILFSKHDVTANPPFLKLDLISCRNLLIYFNTQLQKQVLPVFHYALRSDGHLQLGKSETIGVFKNLFSTVDSTFKLYAKRAVDRGSYTFPQMKAQAKENVVPAYNNLRNQRLTISDMVKETVFNTFDAPYVVVDDNLNMIEVNKDLSAFIGFKSGNVSVNLLKNIVPSLQWEMRSMATKTVKSNKVSKGRIHAVKLLNNETTYVRLKMKPLLYSSPLQPYYMVIFECFDAEDDLPNALKTDGETILDDPRVMQLDQELEATKEHMNTLIEELETSNEELQSTNEELQSSNEELQASNEELETSNEELQATNEELEVAYTEIGKASKQIEEQKNDLQYHQSRLFALFNSTIQGHVLLDNNYNIITFNEKAKEVYSTLFNIRLEEGKSYVDFISADDFKSFHQNFKRALEGKMSQNKVEFDNDVHYVVHYIPIEGKTAKGARSVLISMHDVTAEKRVETRMIDMLKRGAQQRKMLERTFSNAPGYIALFSGKYLRHDFINEKYSKLFGTREVMGRTLRQVYTKKNASILLPHLQGVMQNGKSLRVKEARMSFVKDKKNQEYIFELYISRVTLEGGNDLAILFAHDITEQVQMRERIKAQAEETAQEFLRLLRVFDEAPVTVALHKGAQHVFEYVNKRNKSFFPNRKLEGKPLSTAIPEMAESGLEKIYDEVYRTGQTKVWEELPFQFDDKGKSVTRYFNSMWSPRMDLDNKIDGVTQISYEITDQVNARNLMQSTAEYLNQLLDIMPQKMFVADKTGKNEHINNQFIDYAGLSNEDLVERNWMDTVHPDDLIDTQKGWKKALKDRRSFIVNHRLRNKEGDYRWHLTRTVPLELTMGDDTVKWVGTSTDIHQRVQEEHRKDEFLNIASHELKTPLTSIMAYTELMMEDEVIKGIPHLQQYLKKSAHNEQRLNGLISELLDVSKIENGKLKLSKKKVDFNEVIHLAVQNIAYAHPRIDIRIEGEVKSKVSLDVSRIEQVVSNLLSNAIKYSPENRVVEVDLIEEDERVVVAVKDSGVGIPKKRQAQIFNRYYRVQENARVASGLGIGLFICKQIVDRHKGDMWLESKAHEGSTFYFSLPK